MPNFFLAAIWWRTVLIPSSSIVPLLGLSIVVSILIVVVLPAPLGPRRAKITPCSTSNEIPFTAVKDLKVFVRLRTRIMWPPQGSNTVCFWSSLRMSIDKSYGASLRTTQSGRAHRFWIGLIPQMLRNRESLADSVLRQNELLLE